MQLISKSNKVLRKYTLVVPLKDKNGVIIVNSSQKNLNQSDCKPNKMWPNKGSKFHNRLMKLWLEEMILKCIQHIRKKNLLLPKDLLEL